LHGWNFLTIISRILDLDSFLNVSFEQVESGNLLPQIQDSKMDGSNEKE